MFLFYVLSFFKKGDTRLFKGGLFKEIRYICIFRNKCNCFCKFLTFQSRPSAHQSCFFAGNIPACLEDTDRPKSSGDTKLQKYHIDKNLFWNTFLIWHEYDKLPLIENIFAILPLIYVAIEEIRQTAKRNIENHFSVVGLTSHMKSTFKLFEAYLPSFFRGASNYVEETEQKEGEVESINNLNFNSGIQTKRSTTLTKHNFVYIYCSNYWINCKMYQISAFEFVFSSISWILFIIRKRHSAPPRTHFISGLNS